MSPTNIFKHSQLYVKADKFKKIIKIMRFPQLAHFLSIKIREWSVEGKSYNIHWISDVLLLKAIEDLEFQ